MLLTDSCTEYLIVNIFSRTEEIFISHEVDDFRVSWSASIRDTLEIMLRRVEIYILTFFLEKYLGSGWFSGQY